MRRDKWQTVAIAGMLLVLPVAYGLDRWLEQVEAEATRTFVMAPVVETAVLANLILAALWLGLAWAALATLGRSRLLPLLYLVVGGLVVGAPITAVRGWLPGAFLNITGPASRLGMTGAFLVAIGIGLLIPTTINKHTRQHKDNERSKK